MKKYLLIFSLLLPIIVIAQEQDVDVDIDTLIANGFSLAPPEWCGTGTAVEFSFGVTCNDHGDCAVKFSKKNLSQLKVETDTYQLIDSTVRTKADGRYYVDKNRSSYFFDSLGGYRGKDKANSEGNAYKSYQLTNLRGPLIGSGQVWVMTWKKSSTPIPSISNQQQYINSEYRTQFGITDSTLIPQAPSAPNNQYISKALCSKKNVFFQHKPHLSGSVTRSNASLYYEVDWNSKASREQRSSKITVYAKTERGSGEQIISTTEVMTNRGSVNIPLSGFRVDQGKVYFTATINDGNYSSDRAHIGTHVPTCPTGLTWTVQSSPLGTSYANRCGIDQYSKQCPMSVIPTTPTQYPLLRFTCL